MKLNSKLYFFRCKFIFTLIISLNSFLNYCSGQTITNSKILEVSKDSLADSPHYLKNKPTDTLKVVVKIVVNPNGEVIEAIPGVKGTTTKDEVLLRKAKEAASTSKFTKTSKEKNQIGRMTFKFVVK